MIQSFRIASVKQDFLLFIILKEVFTSGAKLFNKLGSDIWRQAVTTRLRSFQDAEPLYRQLSSNSMLQRSVTRGLVCWILIFYSQIRFQHDAYA